jgi:hypothetical protein
MTNGERPSSLFLSHLSTYPVVSDALQTYKSNPYGAKTLDIAYIAYHKLAAPIMPYLRTPYSILRPYLTKADSIADSGLNKVDQKFPVVKEETGAIKSTVVDYACFPLRVAGESKNYVVGTYQDEHKKVGGEGLVRTAKAIVSTELKLAFDAFGYVTDFLAQRKQQSQNKLNEAQNKLNETQKKLNEKINEKTK